MTKKVSETTTSGGIAISPDKMTEVLRRKVQEQVAAVINESCSAEEKMKKIMKIHEAAIEEGIFDFMKKSTPNADAARLRAKQRELDRKNGKIRDSDLPLSVSVPRTRNSDKGAELEWYDTIERNKKK